jgi:hypothetical protein
MRKARKSSKFSVSVVVGRAILARKPVFWPALVPEVPNAGEHHRQP